MSYSISSPKIRSASPLALFVLYALTAWTAIGFAQDSKRNQGVEYWTTELNQGNHVAPVLNLTGNHAATPAREEFGPGDDNPDAGDQYDRRSEATSEDIAFGASDIDWLGKVQVGYDRGFVIASDEQLDLGVDDEPFHLRLNGWGQLRYTFLDSNGPSQDINQFQLKRATAHIFGLRLYIRLRLFRPVGWSQQQWRQSSFVGLHVEVRFGTSLLGLGERRLRIQNRQVQNAVHHGKIPVRS